MESKHCKITGLEPLLFTVGTSFITNNDLKRVLETVEGVQTAHCNKYEVIIFIGGFFDIELIKKAVIDKIEEYCRLKSVESWKRE